MGNCSNMCGANQKGLLNSHKDTIKKTLKIKTRLEFFKAIQKLSENKIEMNKTRVKEVFEIIKASLTLQESFKEKFFSIIFLYNFLESNKKFKNLLINHQILQILKKDLKKYLVIKKEKKFSKNKDLNWEERYYKINLEYLYFLTKDKNFSSIKSFLKQKNIEKVIPVYLFLNYNQLISSKAEVRKLKRKKIRASKIDKSRFC